MSKNVIMVSKDGKTELVVDTPTDVTQLKAEGFTEKPDESAPRPYAQWLKADLEAEVNKRNETRDEAAQIVVDGKGTVAELAAALDKDDAK